MTNLPPHSPDKTNSTPQHQKRQRQSHRQRKKQSTSSTLDYGDLLRKTDTELCEMVKSITPPSLDDYGVKSIDGDLISFTLPQVTLSSTMGTPAKPQTDTTCAPSSQSSATPTNGHHIPQSVVDSSLCMATTAHSPLHNNNNSDNNNSDDNDDDDNDNEKSNSNGQSCGIYDCNDGYDYDGYDDDNDDDAFSNLTDYTSQHDQSNDSRAPWHSGKADFVVPKMNIRPSQRYLDPNHGVDGSSLVGFSKSIIHDVGHLSIMICGDSGIGKSSLIHAFGVVPEINGPLSTTPYTETVDQSGATDTQGALDNTIMDVSTHDGDSNVSEEIKEWYASTMTPSQKQNQGREPLVKNIRFVDIPGYGAFVDGKAVIEATTKYLERQFQHTNELLSATQPNTPRMARLLHNRHGGHSHVDVCLYLILDRVKKIDIEYLRSLHHLCNVVPVLVKTDLLSRDQEYQLKCKVLQELKDNGIDIYQCGHSLEKLSELCRQGSQVAPPFSISTKFTSNVTNNGGTTVLDSKSGQYHQSSLHHHFSSATGYSKLMHLKDTLFYTHVDQLRQSTVAKFMAWRRFQTSIRRYYRQHQDLHHLAIPSGSTYSSQSTIPLSTTLLSPSSPSPSLLSTASSKEKMKTKNRNEPICNTTMMFDLESIATDLAAREIAERIQDMALKQRSTVRIHMVNYVNEQKELLDRRKNDKLIQLMHTYHTLEQKEKIKFLTGELNGVLSDLGLLASPSPSGMQVAPGASYMGGFLRIFKHEDKSIAVFDPPWLPLLLAVLPVLYFYITSYSG